MLTLEEASVIAGIGRSTLYRHAKNGRLSVQVDIHGRKVCDPAELARCYGEHVFGRLDRAGSPGEIPGGSQRDGNGTQRDAASPSVIPMLERQIERLTADLDHARDRVRDLERQNAELVNRLLRWADRAMLPAPDDTAGESDTPTNGDVPLDADDGNGDTPPQHVSGTDMPERPAPMNDPFVKLVRSFTR